MEGMQEIGAALRAERERQAKSLDEVYRTTRITTRYLADLENGAFEEIPGEVYLKGFLRRYAQYLGLDPEEIVGQYAARKAAQSQAATPEPRPKRAAAKPRPHAGRPSGAGRVVVAVAAIALAAVATGWALAIWSVRTPASPSAQQETTSTTASPSSSAAPEITATPPAAPASDATTEDVPAPAEGSPAASPATSATAPVQVAVRITERCWVRVTADGKLVYQGELEAGTESSWTAQQRLTVRIGNPPGVQVVWNGKAFPVSGKDPVTQVFTPDSSFTAAPTRQKPAKASPAVPAQPTSAPPAPSQAAPAVTLPGTN